MAAFRAVAVVAALLVLVGCGATTQQFHSTPEAASKVDRYAAVLPLVNLTGYPNAGRIVADALATELYRLPNVTFMERTKMQDLVKGGDEDLDYALDKAVARKLGEKLGVDTVFYGSVSEYRYRQGLEQSPAVGMNLRMLDVPSGEVVWAGSISSSGNCFFGCGESLSGLAQDTCRTMVDSMVQAMDPASAGRASE